VRQRDVDRVDRADQVGVDDVHPSLQGRLAFHARDAGLGYDDVDLAELGDAALQRLTELGRLADVGLRRDDAATGLLHQLGGLFEVLGRRHRVADGRDVLAQVDRDDVRAFFGEPDRVAAALAARRAGDKCDFPLHASHSKVVLSHRLLMCFGRR
jgi:hypothetical protein